MGSAIRSGAFPAIGSDEAAGGHSVTTVIVPKLRGLENTIPENASLQSKTLKEEPPPKDNQKITEILNKLVYSFSEKRSKIAL
jgi:hypothetical protein